MLMDGVYWEKWLLLLLMVVIVEQMSIRTQMLSLNVIYDYNIPTIVIYSCTTIILVL